MSRYVFLVTAVGNGYGGLEHRASTALLCSRNDLPFAGMSGLPEGYRTFLGLCSHEYFHTWNVKRIKPAAFTPYDLERENYTTLLWAFEGFTSYYDDLALLRSGAIELKDWLDLMAKTISNVLRTPGRLKQSLAESSFDAWSKFYRPDENTPNAVVSYYAKGALFALALDLTLRAKTDGRVALDDVMRALWERHGKTGIGVGEDDIRRIAEECSGLKLKRLFADGVSGTHDLPLRKLLAPFGVDLTLEVTAAAKTPSLGVKINAEANVANEIRLATVFDGGAAQTAGLAAGDALVAVDGLRVTPSTLDKLLARHQPGDTVRIHAFRRDELMEFTVRLDPPLILWSLDRASDRAAAFHVCDRFAVNVLRDDMKEISSHLSKKGIHAVPEHALAEGPESVPVIRDALAQFVCVVENRFDGGDHVIFVGRVKHFHAATQGAPLLYYRGGYRALAEVA